ncbi:hypothetical protein [Yokenella regensburgei]|uniref:hypothetical protein n=1 Tax=Yokenella regensburgei TaxID=158877 RepID=UPI0031DF8243
MPTTTITLTPADGWVTVFTAAADATVSVEKKTGASPAVLAIDTVAPTIGTGHSIKNLDMKTAVMKAGEILYARCTDELAPGDINVFVITG